MLAIDPAWLAPTPTIEVDHPAVQDFVGRFAPKVDDPISTAVALFYAVRDEIFYDPYLIDLTIAGLSASRSLSLKRGWCVSKAILLAACCRAAGIPTRLGFADVRNHLSTERLRTIMQSDVFVWHGYVLMLLDQRWVKASPAFNQRLTSRFRLRPLEFDGHADALFHPFDLDGKRHMEYIHDRGTYDDVPLESIRATFIEAYPLYRLYAEQADFETDVERETGTAG